MSLYEVIEQKSEGGQARISYGRGGGIGVWIGIFEGVYDEGICHSSLATGTAVVQQESKVRFFFDWSALKRYDSAARASATQWCLRHRKSILRVDFLTKSSFLQMGITVANLVLKSELIVVEDTSEMARNLGDLLGPEESRVPLYSEILNSGETSK